METLLIFPRLQPRNEATQGWFSYFLNVPDGEPEGSSLECQGLTCPGPLPAPSTSVPGSGCRRALLTVSARVYI